VFDPSALARELNPPQLLAALHADGPLLVFAGAGSGKTRVITYRIANLLTVHDVAPWRVLAVTFTNKAAGRDARAPRLLVGPSRAKDLWVATFHATGAKLLRMLRRAPRAAPGLRHLRRRRPARPDVRVYEELASTSGPSRSGGPCTDRPGQAGGAVARRPRRGAGRDPRENIARAWAEYEKRLAAEQRGGLRRPHLAVAKLLEGDAEVRAELQERFHYLLVDEFQDTNNAQYRILRALVGARRNLCVVGDDDQAIYAWRGADVRNIQYFKQDHPDARW
jgi:DNA helicase-2/ATP-dependent DNA helicase PcrA